MRRGEKRRFTVVFSSFPLSFPLFLFSLSPSVSAHGLQCRASGSLALARSLRLFWAGFRWRSRLCCRRAGSGSSGVPLLALISGRRCRWGCVFASLRPRPFLGLVLRPLRCCLGVSRRSRVQCCGSSGAGAGRQCRPKGYSRMYNSVRLYLYDMPLAYCTKR